MDEQVQQALEQDGVIDITTRGRKTGHPRRIEIRFHNEVLARGVLSGVTAG